MKDHTMNPLMLNNSSHFDSPLIIALDFANENQVMQLVSKFDPTLCKLKVGKELFTACGPKLVEKLVISGYQVFLDLKFHDIPNTVYKACKTAANLGVWMLNVHASGGLKMLDLAKQGVIDSGHKTLLIAVTTLTSMNATDLLQIGIQTDIHKHIINLAQLTHNAGLDGVVCSAQEASLIKQNTENNFLTITPGIRLIKEITDDQNKIMTPLEALNNKADYLVIGRPITQSTNPTETLYTIISDIKQYTHCR